MSKKKTIILADDEQDLLDMGKLRLTKEGYDVIVAHDGEEAFENIKKSTPDLIILDINMPPPNSFHLCRMLKDDAKYKRIPIILLTSRAAESDEFWGIESGADAYLTKPYKAEDLIALVKKLSE